MGRFVFAMGRMAFRHGAFRFPHGAFRRPAWGFASLRRRTLRAEEVRPDAAHRAARQESGERSGEKRPYGLGDGLRHRRPVDIQLHHVSFLVALLECLCRASTAYGVPLPCAACQRAHRFAPTVRPMRKAPLAFAYRTARQSEDCLRVRPLHAPALSAKVARLAGAMRRAVGTGALAALGRLATPPPQIPLSPGMRNPSANAPCMAWSGYLPAPCNAVSRRLAHPGAESALATWSSPPIPPALFAECRRKRCRLHLSLCAIHELRTSLARVCLLGAERGVEAATRGGASADDGTRKTPRLRLRGATGGIPTKRLATQARLDCAPYDGCARGSRKCAEESGAFGGKPRKERSD